MTEQVLRLFVSSPGDVIPERQRVDLVVERLNSEFEGLVRIETVRWETSYYSAHDTFQKQIPEAANCDVVVAIFRTRLGSKLPATFPTQPSGEPYPSGTAYEVLSAMEWRKTTGKDLPDVYVFRYPRAPSVELDAPNREEIAAQWGQLKGFFDTWFLNTSGEFLAAFQDYSSTDDFALKVEDCLRQWLARRGFLAQGAVWDRVLKGSPFPGLSAFEAGHGTVFFGRDLAIAQAIERLRQVGKQEDERTPFLLIIGASGSGKSSLLRAGLLPRLTLPGTIPEIDLWRTATVMPGPDLFLALAEALLAEAALGPELRQSAFADKALLARQLAGDPDLALAPLRAILKQMAERRRADAHFDEVRPARLALGIDQAERIFTEADPAMATAFAALIAALVKGGLAYVIFAMRSDTYARFQGFEALVALREAGGTLDLVPPNTAELEEIVTRPIDACHPPLTFEQADGQSLATQLVTDTKGGDALPLLQMTLSRLYAAEEVRGDGILRFADYRGMDAAVTETANEALESLDIEARAALPALIAGLVADVTVDSITGEQAPVIAALDRTAFEAGNPARRALADTFVAKRLLTTDGDGVRERLRPVHEALLRIWPQAVGIIAEAGNLFRVRRTLEPIVRDWERASGDKERHLDISPALLSGAQSLVERFDADLPPAMRAFVAASAAAAAAREHQEREAQERRLHDAEALAVANRRIARGASAGLVMALLLVAIAGYQWHVAQVQRDLARQTVTLATDAANGLVFDMADKFRNVFGVPAATVKDILSRASDLQERLLTVAGGDPKLRLSQVHALIKTSETLLDLGETKSALSSATEAQTIAHDLETQHPENARYRQALALAEETVGNVRFRQGDTPEAMSAFQASLILREDLAKAGDTKPTVQRELAQSHRAIGDMLFRQGKLPEAIEAYQAGFAIRKKLTNEHPDDLAWQADLSVSYQKIGNVLAAQGKLSEAMKSYRESLALRIKLVQADPNNPTWQNELAHAYSSVGDMLVKQGNLPEAMKAYQPELAIVDRLAKSDPGHASWQSDLSNADVKVGEVLAAEENLPEAMKYYQASLAIRDRLVKSDPDNVIWERSIAISHERVGDVLVAQGNLVEAMKAYQTSLDIRGGLVKSDPTNANWQHDLAVSNASIGDVLIEQEKLSDAMQAYRRAKDIIDGLSAANPGNATWLRDLSNVEIRIGDILFDESALVDALQSYQAGLAISDRLAKIDPNNEVWQHALSVSYDRVGNVLVRQGNFDEALKASMTGLAIADQLAKTGTGNAGWQSDLADSYIRVGEPPDRQDDVSDNGVSNHTGGGIGNRLLSTNASNADWQSHLSSSHNRVGQVQFAKGDLTDALKSYQASLAITDQLAKADPGNARAQYNLSVAHEFIGEVLAAQARLPEALEAYQASLAIRDQLAKADASDAGWRDSLSAAYENVGDVLLKQNKLPDAVKAYQASLTIREALSKADPADADWQHDLSASYASLADVYRKQGKTDEARAALNAGHAIVAPYAAQHPESADWKKDMEWFDQQIAEVGK